MRFLRNFWEQYITFRVININVNILLAGLISLALAGPFVRLTTFYLHSDRAIALFSFVLDGIFDFAAFISLHGAVYLALKHRKKIESRPFFKDIAEIQSHRIILSVVFFVLAVGGHLFWMHHGLERTHAFMISYGTALILVRVLHTRYGVNSGLFD
jgi:hypothetical protein